jgi:hypothetical protein
MTVVGPEGDARVSRLERTTYEGLKTSYWRWHGDMTDIVDQR